MNTLLPDDLIYPAQAAELLRVTEATLRNYANTGLLTAYTTPGGHRRYSRREVLAAAHMKRDQ